jgi:hypothetical protein
MTVQDSSANRTRRDDSITISTTSTRPRAKIAAALSGAALLGFTGAGVSASPAGASVTRSVSVARANATSDTNYVTLNFKNGTSHGYPCDGGSTFHTDMPNYIKSATNNCHVRVWLHTHNDNSGYSACMNPQHSYTADDTIKYVNVYVSTNASDCQY